MCNLCDARQAKTDSLFGEGTQYRLSALSYWKDIEPGQKSFGVTTADKIEFRKKPKMVATITYDTNTAEFYDEDWLKRAIDINLQNGTEFELKIEFK